jgi:hypothetical protein
MLMARFLYSFVLEEQISWQAVYEAEEEEGWSYFCGENC